MALEPETDAWARIRYAYEHTDQPIGDICIAHGISSGTLRDRMRRWHWTRRRQPIPREGPPPRAVASWETEIMTPSPTLPLSGGGSESAAPISDNGEAAPRFAPAPCAAELHAASAFDPEADAAAIVPRLRSASARVLPAIEATIARLAAGAHHPREMEQAGRALSALTRTLRELNTLLSQHSARAAAIDDSMPEDMDAFRLALAHRIDTFVASRMEDEEEAKDEET